MNAARDYYTILGVKKTDSPEDIKKAYRRLARKFHPDLNPGKKDTEEKFKEINEAYAVIGDAEKRKQYDAGGSTAFEGMDFNDMFRQRAGGQKRGVSRAQYEDAFDMGLGDIFGDILGQRSAGRAQRGADLTASVEITLEEAFSGVSKRMSFTREVACEPCEGSGVESSVPCQRCGGTGRLGSSKGFFRVENPCPECGGAGRKITHHCPTCGGQGRTFRIETNIVKIPPGVQSGSTLKLRGLGNAGTGGGPSGDLRLTVHITPHERFERTDDDLYLKLPLTIAEAVLGARVEVPTIEGASVMMTIPAGTQSGMRFKLTGKGFTKPGAAVRGNMYVDALVAVPRHIDDKVRKAVEALEQAYTEHPRGVKP